MDQTVEELYSIIKMGYYIIKRSKMVKIGLAIDFTQIF